MNRDTPLLPSGSGTGDEDGGDGENVVCVDLANRGRARRCPLRRDRRLAGCGKLFFNDFLNNWLWLRLRIWGDTQLHRQDLLHFPQIALRR